MIEGQGPLTGSVSSTTLTGAVDSEFSPKPPLLAEIACVDLMALVAVFDKPKRKPPPPPVLEVVIPGIPLIEETPKEDKPKPPLVNILVNTAVLVQKLLQQSSSSSSSSSSISPPKPCCCCVASLSMTAVRSPSSDPQYVEVREAKFGHIFTVQCGLIYQPGSPPSICNMQWWEWCDNFGAAGLPNNTWINMTNALPGIVTVPTFVPWKKLNSPKCPQGGPDLIVDHDQAEGGAGQDDYHRLLKIQVVVSSGPGCPCGAASKTLAWEQLLEKQNGKITAWDWHFTSASF